MLERNDYDDMSTGGTDVLVAWGQVTLAIATLIGVPVIWTLWYLSAVANAGLEPVRPEPGQLAVLFEGAAAEHAAGDRYFYNYRLGEARLAASTDLSGKVKVADKAEMACVFHPDHPPQVTAKLTYYPVRGGNTVVREYNVSYHIKDRAAACGSMWASLPDFMKEDVREGWSVKGLSQ